MKVKRVATDLTQQSAFASGVKTGVRLVMRMILLKFVVVRANESEMKLKRAQHVVIPSRSNWSSLTASTVRGVTDTLHRKITLRQALQSQRTNDHVKAALAAGAAANA
jgi:hypothetical protein